MMKLLAASAILAVAWQTAAAGQSAAADGARTALRACIKQATTDAKSQKLGADAITALIHEKCTAEEVKFKSAVWAFDSKNKVSKRQSESDATLQIDDFVASAADRYSIETTPQ